MSRLYVRMRSARCLCAGGGPGGRHRASVEKETGGVERRASGGVSWRVGGGVHWSPGVGHLPGRQAPASVQSCRSGRRLAPGCQSGGSGDERHGC